MRRVSWSDASFGTGMMLPSGRTRGAVTTGLDDPIEGLRTRQVKDDREGPRRHGSTVMWSPS
jgi:hypothetical protein